MAIPTLLGIGAHASSTSSLTVVPPSEQVAGCVELLFVESSAETDTPSLVTAAGFAPVTGAAIDTGVGPGGTFTDGTVFWRRWNGTDGSPSLADIGNHQQAIIVAFENVIATGDPYEAVTTSTDTTEDTSGAILGGTTADVDRLVVAFIASAKPDALGGAVFSGWTNGNLTSVTERVDVTTDLGNGGAIGIVTGIKATAGAVGTTTVTVSTTTTKAMISFALKPSSGALSGYVLEVDNDNPIAWWRLGEASSGSGGGAVSITNKFVYGDAVDRTSYTTASWTPAINKAYLCAVTNRAASAIATPTLSGNGLTWVQVATVEVDGNKRLTMFSTVGVASPSTGVLTASFGGATQTAFTIVVDELTNGKESDPVNLSNKATNNDTGSTTSINVTAPNAVASGNALYAAQGLNGVADNSGDSNYTVLDQIGITPQDCLTITQYDSDGGDLTATFSGPATATRMAIIVEVKAGEAGGGGGSVDYVTAVDADSPSHHWRMGESSGTVVDRIGAAEGTAVGSPTRNVTGLINVTDDDGGIDFSGTGQYVDLANALVALDTTWTLEAWMRIDSLTGGGFLLYFFDNTGGVNKLDLEYADTGLPRVTWTDSGGGNRILVGPTALLTGVVYHLVATHDGTTARLYVNGVEVANTSTWNSRSFGASDFVTRRIGAPTDTSTFAHDGVIDEATIYDTALSATRILEHYNSGIGAAGGTVLDSAGTTTGITVGTVVLDVTGLINATDDDGAIDFDGVDGSINIASVPALGSTWSMEAWARPDTLAAMRIATFDGIKHPSIGITAEGYAIATWRNSSLVTQTLTSTPFAADFGYRAGQPIHILATHSGNLTTLYVNGVVVGTDSIEDSESVASGQWNIAKRETTLYWNGVIDEVALYSTALSAERAEAHFAAGVAQTGYPLAVMQDGPYNYWRMGEPADRVDKNLLLNTDFELTTPASYWDGSTFSAGVTDGAAPFGSKVAHVNVTSHATTIQWSHRAAAIDRTIENRFSFYSWLRTLTAGTWQLKIYEYDAALTVLTQTTVLKTWTTTEGAFTRYDFRVGPDSAGGRHALHADTRAVVFSFESASLPLTSHWDLDGVMLETGSSLSAWEAKVEAWASLSDSGYANNLAIFNTLGNGIKDEMGLINATDDDGAVFFNYTVLTADPAMEQKSAWSIEFVLHYITQSSSPVVILGGDYPKISLNALQESINVTVWDGFEESSLSSPAASVRRGEMSCIVITHDGHTTIIYVNGDEVTNSEHTSAPLAQPAVKAIGHDPATTLSRFYGTLDEIALYANGLSQERVTAHWLACEGVAGGMSQNISAGLSFTGATPAKRSSKALTSTLTPAVVFSRGFLKLQTLAASLGFSGANTKHASKTVSGTLAFGSVFTRAGTNLVEFIAELDLISVLNKGREYILEPNDTILSFTGGALIRKIGKVLSASISPTRAFVKKVNKSITANLSPTGVNTRAKLLLRPLTGTLSFTGSIARRTGKSLTGTLLPTGNHVLLRGRSFLATLGPTAAISKRAARSLTAGLTSLGQLSDQLITGAGGEFFVSIGASLSFAINTIKKTSRSLAGGTAFGDPYDWGSGTYDEDAPYDGTNPLIKHTNRLYNVILSFTTSITKATSRAFDVVQTFSTTMTEVFEGLELVFFDAALNFVGNVNKRSTSFLEAFLQPVGELSRMPGKALAAALTFSGAVIKSGSHLLAGGVSFTGNVSTEAQKRFTAALDFTTNLGKTSTQFLTATLEPIGEMGPIKLFVRMFEATLNITTTMLHNMAKVVNATLSPSGVVNKQVRIVLGGVVTFSNLFNGIFGTIFFATRAYVLKTKKDILEIYTSDRVTRIKNSASKRFR